MTDESIVVVVDARGHRCPVPTLRLRKAIATAPAGGLVRLAADDPLARVDAPLLVREMGCQLISIEETEGVLSFTLRISESLVGK